jgi:hypothetical protein
MNKKRPIPEVVDEKKTPMPEVVLNKRSNLWYKFLFIHPQPQVCVSFYSSTISVIGLISFIHNLLNRSLLIHPPYTRGCG